MSTLTTRLCRVLSLATIGSVSATAFAQESAPPPPAELEEIIVTAVARPVELLESSVSVSSVSQEELFKVAPRSIAEVFRSLPGIRAESSGGRGNANITIRGIPLATGGSKYMQIWEDGLPVLEYGDINFANTDNFVRYDGSIARIEVIRGGSASTFASNSPGGVINLISRTGGEDTGAIAVGFGVDYEELRLDFNYGGSLSETVDFHVGGFFREGEGVRETGFDGDSGGQVKANVTKYFDDGYLRFYLKHLDDRVTTYLPSPVLVESNGNFSPLPGYDASTQTLLSAYQTSVSTFDAFGNRRQRDVTDGIESKVDAFGVEFASELQDWHIINKFRISDIRGGFISPFTDTFGIGVVPAQQWGDALCAVSTDAAGNPVTGCNGTVVTLANGPNAGQVYSGLAFTNLLFDTTFNDVGLLVNDLRVSREFGSMTLTLGYYTSKQNIDIDWNSWQFRVQTVDGTNSQALDIVSTTGQQVAQEGLYWPGLLSWAWDLQYDTSAPYLNFAFDFDRFNFDASVRFDETQARGTRSAACCGGGQGIVVDFNNDGVIEPWEARGVAVANNVTTVNYVNYDADHTSFSVGGAFLLNDNSSVFARYSEGGRAVADRLLQIPGALNADGTLSSTTDGYDDVNQLELGYKLRTDALAFYATFFNTSVEESNAEITSGLTFVREYAANGVELAGQWNIGDFAILGNATWTDAEIENDRINPAVEGNTPRRQADLIYTLTPQYFVDRFSFGATLQGTSDYSLSDANELRQDGYVLVHLFGRYDINDALSITANVNNVTDEFVLTESEEGAFAVPGSIIRARPVSGRSTFVSLHYDFF